MYLYTDNKCYSICPFGYFGQLSPNTCVSCDTTSCNGCVGSATSCINCANSYVRVIGSTICTNDCGAGYYASSLTKSCTVCPVGCAACSSATVCTICQNVAGVSYYLLNSQCSINCPTNQYGGIDGSNNPICTVCVSPCLTCTSISACLSCTVPSGKSLVYGTTTCDNCPDGQYSSSQVCLLCSINCVTCSTSSSSCDSCGRSVYGIDLFFYSHACIATCPVQYFAYITNHTCIGCDPSCFTCSGSLPTNCITCNSGSF